MIIDIVRAVVLYHLAEHQSGNATTIRVSAQDHAFRTTDDGRGHAIDRTINGLPYLTLVYSHLDYPFGLSTETPIQLHTIGMSLVNALCSELVVTVHKADKIYRTSFKDGSISSEATSDNHEHGTGTTIEGQIDPHRFPEPADLHDLEQWLRGVKSAHPSLRLFYNDAEL